MKKILTLSLVLMIAASASAQKKKKYEKIYFAEVTKEMGPVTVVISNSVATDAYIKFKFTVKNNTGDFILLKADDIILKSNGKEIKNTEKELLIGPNDEDYRTIDIKGGDFLQVENFSLDIKGISKIPAKAKSEDAENFKLPVAKNEFEAGPFHVLQLKNEKKTDLVAVKFTATYNGNKIGIVNPGQASMLTPKGTEFANMGTKGQRKPFLLKKGQEDNFTLYWKDIPVANGDMQFANVEVIWNDAFIEATPETVPAVTVDVAMDQGLTEGKNK